MGKKAGGFYAVARGRSVGVFLTWDECKAQVDGFTSARYKKFPTTEEANAFIAEHSGVQHSSAATHLKSSSLRYAPKVNPTAEIMGLQKPSSSGYSASTKKTLSINSAAPKRDFSSLKVTEDRVINKRAKMDRAASNSRADLSNFNVDEGGFVVVYTDGACTKNGRKAAKAGIGVWFGNSHPLNISEPVEGRQTNNTAEIQAAERAIREAKLNGINKLMIKTDSQFTINCVTKWLNNWKRNNWRLSSGGDVKNKEDLVKLDDAMQNMEIKWVSLCTMSCLFNQFFF
ncbi:unnamed protein product [Orchesella dallaii]|uniref:Ribonuclease H1 n=1 Tax=Orchesella dallaii TaxID=48710 RepID=A0ABP1QFZ5_9HEXA